MGRHSLLRSLPLAHACARRHPRPHARFHCASNDQRGDCGRNYRRCRCRSFLPRRGAAFAATPGVDRYAARCCREPSGAQRWSWYMGQAACRCARTRWERGGRAAIEALAQNLRGPPVDAVDRRCQDVEGARRRSHADRSVRCRQPVSPGDLSHVGLMRVEKHIDRGCPPTTPRLARLVPRRRRLRRRWVGPGADAASTRRGSPSDRRAPVAPAREAGGPRASPETTTRRHPSSELG